MFVVGLNPSFADPPKHDRTAHLGVSQTRGPSKWRVSCWFPFKRVKRVYPQTQRIGPAPPLFLCFSFWFQGERGKHGSPPFAAHPRGSSRARGGLLKAWQGWRLLARVQQLAGRPKRGMGGEGICVFVLACECRTSSSFFPSSL